MNAIIKVYNENTNTPTIVIRRSMSFKTIPTNAGDLNKVLKAIIINLSNAGYNVSVDER